MKSPCIIKLLPLLIFIFLSNYFFCIAGETKLFINNRSGQDTLFLKQLLFNGRIWKNDYFNIEGHPFLFSDKFLRGSVNVAGKSFGNILLLYDIFRDEILTVTGNNIIIQLNKEMVQAFTIDYENRTYSFINADNCGWNNLNGYVNVLYGGKIPVFAKYKKLTEPPSVGSIENRIYQVVRIYLVKNDQPYQVRNRRHLLTLLKDRKKELKNFIRGKKLTVTLKIPGSIVPVTEFYEGLSH